MTEAPDQGLPGGLAVRRILAAFGPAGVSAGILESVVDLAGRLGAELDMLLVEDVTLLEWTELPFIRQISLHGQAAMPLSQRELESQFRALAIDAQRRLTALATSQQLRSSFRTARGQILIEVSAAAAQTDLLVLASGSQPIAREALLDLSVRSLIEVVGAPVLQLRPEQHLRGPMHVALEDLGKAEKLLDAANAIAHRFAETSVVTAWAIDTLGERELAEVLGDRAPAIRLQHISGPATIEALLSAVGSSTLMLSATSGLLRIQSWWQHFARARCALLLVR